MATTKRRYPKEEIVQRGEVVFEKEIKPQLKGRDAQEFVVIDIETGAYEVDANELAACDRLRERVDAQIYAALVRDLPVISSDIGRSQMMDRRVLLLRLLPIHIHAPIIEIVRIMRACSRRANLRSYQNAMQTRRLAPGDVAIS